MSGFTGFPHETIQFFLDLRYHNNTTWFHEHRPEYERAIREPFYALIAALTPALTAIDPMMETRPNRLLARINRDIRFSRDKSPYRDHLWIWFHRAAEPREKSIGFWFELGPSNVGWGLAMWGDNRPLMERFRREMAAHPRKTGQIIRSCGLEEHGLALTGDVVRRMVIPPNVPAWMENWYRVKEPVIVKMHPDYNLVWTEDILTVVQADFEALAPIYRLFVGIREEMDAEETEEEATGIVRRQEEW